MTTEELSQAEKSRSVCRDLIAALAELERAGVSQSQQDKLAAEICVLLGRPVLCGYRATALNRLEIHQIALTPFLPHVQRGLVAALAKCRNALFVHANAQGRTLERVGGKSIA